MSGMVKVIYSSAFDNAVDVSMRLIEDPSVFTKKAGSVFGVECESLRPNSDCVGIHITALGAFERYGANRNGDSFPRAACERYHDTFVKHGALFRHHRNKDRGQNLGTIAASAYNRDMDRVELFVHAHKERARSELDRLDKESEIPFSMACFAAGTLVSTLAGFKKIEDVESGDFVLTHTGGWRRVGNRSVRDVSELVRLCVRGWCGTAIETTPNHPFYAAPFDGDKPGRDNLHRNLVWVPAVELTPGHCLAVPIERDVSSHVSVEEARWIGYYVACGSVVGDCALFVCHGGSPVLDEIAGLARGVVGDADLVRREYGLVRCSGLDFAKRVFDGCGTSACDKAIPDRIRRADRDARMNFAAAWLNAAGRQDKQGLHWFVSSHGAALDLQRLLASVDIPASCARCPRGKRGAGGYSVSTSNDYSSAFVGISAARPLSGGADVSGPFISGDYLMAPVMKAWRTETEQPVPVYNFSVETDESYTVYGFAAHNCKVAFDRCNRCGTTRKNGDDPNQCDHVRFELGKMAEDGSITCTHNDEPDFFDISFVGRPADRIAWHLKLANGSPIDSVALAEESGLVVPDRIAISSTHGRAKLAHLERLAGMQGVYRDLLSSSSDKHAPKEMYLRELRKAAGTPLSSETLSELRALAPSMAFYALGRAGTILDANTFFKYAFGDSFGEMAPFVGAAARAVPHTIESAVRHGNCQRICNDGMFDVDSACRAGVRSGLSVKLAEYSVTGPARDERIIAATADKRNLKFAVDTGRGIWSNDGGVTVLAEKYAAYAVSAIEAVFELHKDTDRDSVIAVVAAQNLLT